MSRRQDYACRNCAFRYKGWCDLHRKKVGVFDRACPQLEHTEYEHYSSGCSVKANRTVMADITYHGSER